jgi:CcmD family protein
MLLSRWWVRWGAPVLLLLAVCAVPVLAQSMPAEGLASQSLRPFRFVFIAYAIAWILVFGWVVSVARRVSSLSRRLED